MGIHLSGPYPLTEDGVAEAVTASAPGVFALGMMRNGAFYVGYVGRAELDLARELDRHELAYSHFKFNFADTAEDAFQKECELFHAFAPPANAHPSRPRGSQAKCPICKK